MTLEALLAGGVLMGLAGSLHCAGQCGGIAASLLLATQGEGAGAASRIRTASVLQLGRVLTYVLAGTLVGTMGGTLDFLLRLSGAQPALRLLASLVLVWSGLSIAGVFPAIATLDGRLPRLSGGRLRASPLLAGLGWGFAPCAMVYNALLTAMLAGSPQGGAMFMAGFGLATVPAVGAVALGAVCLKAGASARRRRSMLRRGLGLALAALGLVSLAEPAMSLSALCLTAV